MGSFGRVPRRCDSMCLMTPCDVVAPRTKVVAEPAVPYILAPLRVRPERIKDCIALIACGRPDIPILFVALALHPLDINFQLWGSFVIGLEIRSCAPPALDSLGNIISFIDLID